MQNSHLAGGVIEQGGIATAGMTAGRVEAKCYELSVLPTVRSM